MKVWRIPFIAIFQHPPLSCFSLLHSFSPTMCQLCHVTHSAFQLLGTVFLFYPISDPEELELELDQGLVQSGNSDGPILGKIKQLDNAYI